MSTFGYGDHTDAAGDLPPTVSQDGAVAADGRPGDGGAAKDIEAVSTPPRLV